MNLKTATLTALIGMWFAFLFDTLKLMHWLTVYSGRSITTDWTHTALSVVSLLSNNIPLLIFLTVLYRKQQNNG